ncbi:MAG: c-type cytochrome [Candidatus Acidiferrum sp.]
MISHALDTPIRRLSYRLIVIAFLYVFGATNLCNALGQTQAPPNDASKTPPRASGQGRQLFESVCAGCHGLDGRGGERGPDISTRQQVVQLSDADLLEILRGGRPAAGMPPFDSLGNLKLKALLAYLRSLQGRGAVAALPGDPRNGKSLFFGKARCSQCHMVQGAGGFLGRDLSNYGTTLSAADIRSNILRSPNSSNKANKTAIITMRDSRKFTGVVRNEDNFSIQLQSLDGAFHFLTKSDVARVEFLPDPIMPSDYGTTLKPSELDDLVGYLVTAARAGRIRNQADEDNDN